MTQKACPSPFDPKGDTATDYALIAAGVAAALFALVYLILI
jgi:Flp pilus assembly pilin Flp